MAWRWVGNAMYSIEGSFKSAETQRRAHNVTKTGKCIMGERTYCTASVVPDISSRRESLVISVGIILANVTVVQIVVWSESEP